MGIDNQFEREAEEEELEEELLDEGFSDEDGFSAKKAILMVVLPLFILAGVGSGLYFTGTLDSLMGGDKKEEQVEEDEYGNVAAVGAAHFLEIPNMIVNLNSPDGQPRYLRLSVQLEMDNPADVSAVEAVMPRVIDQFQTYLRELRIKDLRGSKGVYRLQMELLNRVNAAAYPVEIKDVLFQEILIQ
jgi:flagellar FliL protein